MKKLIAALLLIGLVFGSASALDDFMIEAYGGIGVEMASASGFKKVIVSDYKHYGNSQGSLYLPLEEMNGTGALFTVQIGARYELIPSIYVLGEVCVGFAGTGNSAYQFDVGGIYVLPFNFMPNLHLGVGAKLGFFGYTRPMGKASVITGTRGPVILNEGTIYNGYELSFSSAGFDITPYVNAYYGITDTLSVGMDLGFQLAVSIANQLTAKENSDDENPINLSTDSGDFYDYERYTSYNYNTQDRFKAADLNPKVSLTGLKTSVYVIYKF